MPTIAHQVPIVRPAITSPPVDSRHATNRFHRRSFMRSETVAQPISTTPATAYGIIVSQPTVMLLVTPRDLMICGMKISIPRLAVTIPR